VEWAEHGITVNAICPGFFMTDNNRVLQRDPVAFEHYLSIIPQRRFGDCGEIGPLALYLASNAAAYVTGSEFYIDGGWTTR
jgi:gluconate 5-dehydrogenase